MKISLSITVMVATLLLFKSSRGLSYNRASEVTSETPEEESTTESAALPPPSNQQITLRQMNEEPKASEDYSFIPQPREALVLQGMQVPEKSEPSSLMQDSHNVVAQQIDMLTEEPKYTPATLEVTQQDGNGEEGERPENDALGKVDEEENKNQENKESDKLESSTQPQNIHFVVVRQVDGVTEKSGRYFNQRIPSQRAEVLQWMRGSEPSSKTQDSHNVADRQVDGVISGQLTIQEVSIQQNDNEQDDDELVDDEPGDDEPGSDEALDNKPEDEGCEESVSCAQLKHIHKVRVRQVDGATGRLGEYFNQNRQVPSQNAVVEQWMQGYQGAKPFLQTQDNHNIAVRRVDDVTEESSTLAQLTSQEVLIPQNDNEQDDDELVDDKPGDDEPEDEDTEKLEPSKDIQNIAVRRVDDDTEESSTLAQLGSQEVLIPQNDNEQDDDELVDYKPGDDEPEDEDTEKLEPSSQTKDIHNIAVRRVDDVTEESSTLAQLASQEVLIPQNDNEQDDDELVDDKPGDDEPEGEDTEKLEPSSQTKDIHNIAVRRVDGVTEKSGRYSNQRIPSQSAIVLHMMEGLQGSKSSQTQEHSNIKVRQVDEANKEQLQHNYKEPKGPGDYYNYQPQSQSAVVVQWLGGLPASE